MKTTANTTVLAVCTIVFTVFAMSIGDALVKQLGTQSTLGVWQLFLLRSALALPVLVVAGLIAGAKQQALSKPTSWVWLRSALLIAVWIVYYASLPHIPLSVAAAALYTLPLFIVGFSALWTEDTVTKTHAWATVIGFAGVLLVLRPAGDAFSPYALLPILAAMLFALAMVLTRVHCQQEHPLAMAANLHLSFILAGSAGLIALQIMPGLQTETFLSRPWHSVDAQQWRLLILLAASLLIASVGTALAYQKAPGAIIGTFEFAYVGFAVLWGFVFFGEVPDGLTLAGFALIVTAGILTIRQ